MAYITTEQVAKFRTELKSIFPKNFKFSITRENYSSINVCLMASPLNIECYGNRRIKNHKTIERIIKDVINKDNFDHSDSMVDYHHVGYYANITLGKWDKPYVQINN